LTATVDADKLVEFNHLQKAYMITPFHKYMQIIVFHSVIETSLKTVMDYHQSFVGINELKTRFFQVKLEAIEGIKNKLHIG
jgi:hypothetical protein